MKIVKSAGRGIFQQKILGNSGRFWILGKLPLKNLGENYLFNT